MLFLLRPYRRFPLQCSVTVREGPFQGQDIVWNLPVPAVDFLAIWPCDQEKLFHLPSHSPIEQRIEISEAGGRWSVGEELRRRIF